MGKECLPVCSHCGRRFRPSKFNRHHQRWCGDSDCVRARDRARKRKHYRKRKMEDPEFGDSERQRCRDGMRRLREKLRNGGVNASPQSEAEPLPSASFPASFFSELIAGLISQLTDTDDPGELQRHFCIFADRGRRLTVPAFSRHL